MNATPIFINRIGYGCKILFYALISSHRKYPKSCVWQFPSRGKLKPFTGSLITVVKSYLKLLRYTNKSFRYNPEAFLFHILPLNVLQTQACLSQKARQSPQSAVVSPPVHRGRYHGGRRPSSDDSLHSPTVIPPSALDKQSLTTQRTTR